MGFNMCFRILSTTGSFNMGR